MTNDTAAFVKSLNLLTSKPVIYVANVCEDDLADDGANNAMVAKVREFAETEGSDTELLPVSCSDRSRNI